MTTTTSTVTISAANASYTLGSGNTISIASSTDNNNSGEAIYTDYSPTNATTIGGPTITIDGVILDNSAQASANEYAVQSRSAADATLFNYGTIESPNLVAIGFNNGLIVNELGGTIIGAGGIRIGTGTLASTIINEGEILSTNSAAIGFLNTGATGFITNASSGYIRGGTTGGAQAETGIYMISGTITNAGTIAAGGTAGDSVDFFGTAGGNKLILDPGQVLTGLATAAGSIGNVLVLGGTGLGTLTNPGNYLGFVTMAVATGADWQIGTAGSTVSISGISTIKDFGTLNIAGAIAGTTINMEGSIAGTATEVDFTGAYSATPIVDYGSNDELVFATLAGGPGVTFKDSYNTANGVLTVTEINAAGATIGAASATVSGAPGTTLTSGSFVDINGPNGETIVLGSSTLANQGSIYLNDGNSATLTNTGTPDTVPVTFGNSQGAGGVLNTLDINGSVSGTSNPYQGAISGFGLNDDIVIGPSVLPSLTAGEQVSLTYAGSDLTVTEYNTAGVSIGSTTLDIGTGYAASSFVALLGTNGVNIETPATVDEHPLTFSTSGTGDIETPSDYVGGLAPGSSIVAGETVIIASGTATVSASAPISDSGTIIVSGASSGFIDTSGISGGGVLDLQAGGQAAIVAPSGFADINMGGNGADTSLYLFGNYAGTGHAQDGPTITGFGATDSIILPGFTAIAGDQLVYFYNSLNGQLSLSEYDGATQDESALITISGPGGSTLSNSNIFASFGADGLVVTDMPCFASGTRILTADGQRSVESLKAGDHVLTVRDGTEQEIIWTGQRTIDLTRHAWPEKVQPVVILAGAFGEGLPERDLTLSPDHALFIDGHLIEAKTLVNGATIIRDRAAKYVTYHHIELARHDVVLAEGLAAETYLESGNRQNFDADAGPVALHPDFASASRAGACAALLTDGAILRQLRQNLLDRALALGFCRTDSLDISAKAGAERLDAIIDPAASEIMFVLPPAAPMVTLGCPTGVPAEVLADPSDRRELGVAISGLALIAGGRRVEIDMHDPAHTGLHASEGRYRWTSGAATIALPPYTGRAVLEVTLGGRAMRWLHGKAARFITAM